MEQEESKVSIPAYWYKRTQLFIKNDMIPQCGYEEVRVFLVLPNDTNIEDHSKVNLNLWFEYVLPNKTIIKPDMSKLNEQAILEVVNLITTLDDPTKKDSIFKDVAEEECIMNRYLVAKGLLYWLLYDLFLAHNGKKVEKGTTYNVAVDAIEQHHTVTTTTYETEDTEENTEEE